MTRVIAPAEIRATIRRLQKSGEYERYLHAEADERTAEIALRLAMAFPLTDHDVAQIMALPLPEEAELDTEETRLLVERVVRRARGDDDDGQAGVPALRR